MWSHIKTSAYNEEIKHILTLDKEYNVFFLVESASIDVCAKGTIVIENSNTMDWYSFKVGLRYDFGASGGGGFGAQNTRTIAAYLKESARNGCMLHYSIRVVGSDLYQNFIECKTDWKSVKCNSVSAYLSEDQHVDKVIIAIESILY